MAELGIYLIKRTDRIDYDEFDSMVVAAATIKDALAIHPDGKPLADRDQYDYYGWAIDTLDIKCVGTTTTYNKPTVILASFRAG